MASSLVERVGSLVGGLVVETRPVAGGCINSGVEAILSDGTRMFVKSNPDAPAGFFRAEAAALDWIGAAGVIAVPEVIGFDDGSDAFLALEWIETGNPDQETDASLGRGLAGLHRERSDAFGWSRQGFIGSLPQDNRPTDDWPTFYGSRRIEPLAHEAVDRGLLPQSSVGSFETLLNRLPELAGPPEPPSRLHGDLWSGNWMAGFEGQPWLIDPAPYGGHREVDLAMMRLFGGFSRDVFDAYEEVYPLSDGHKRRVALYQMYPLLVHTLIFGGGYASSVLATLAEYT